MAVIYNPNVFLQPSAERNRERSQVFQQIAQSFQRGQELKAAEAEQARKEALVAAKEAGKPINIIAKAQQFGIESLTPQELATAKAWEQMNTGLTKDESGYLVADRPPVFSQVGQMLAPPPVAPVANVPSTPSLPQGAQPIQGVSQGVLKSPKAQMERIKTDEAVRAERGKLDAKGEFEQRKYEREKLQAQPKIERAFKSLGQDVMNISGVIDDVMQKTDWKTAGFVGKGLSMIAGTEATDVEANLKTIQADAAFGRLQEMRDNSPTGGALGQVSERELALLQNAKVALDQSQSPEQLKENLARYKQIRKTALENTAEAYRQDYGNYPKGMEQEPKDEIIEDGYRFLGGDKADPKNWELVK